MESVPKKGVAVPQNKSEGIFHSNALYISSRPSCTLTATKTQPAHFEQLAFALSGSEPESLRPVQPLQRTAPHQRQSRMGAN
eukprot:3849275-Amphidinium_carterae.2